VQVSVVRSPQLRRVPGYRGRVGAPFVGSSTMGRDLLACELASLFSSSVCYIYKGPARLSFFFPLRCDSPLLRIGRKTKTLNPAAAIAGAHITQAVFSAFALPCHQLNPDYDEKNKIARFGPFIALDVCGFFPHVLTSG